MDYVTNGHLSRIQTNMLKALEAGMVLCVEALVAPEGGDFSIKLEDQVLVTETGHEILTTYPFDTALMGEA